MAKALEFLSDWLSGVALQNEVPLLHSTHEMEGGEPHLVALRGMLGAEEPIAAVEPAERVILAIVCGKRDFVVARNGRSLEFWRHVGKGWWHVHGGGGGRQCRLHDGGEGWHGGR